MKKLITVLFILSLLLALGCEKKPVEGTVIAKVNKSVFTLEDLEDQIPPYISIPADRKKAFIDEWINTELVYSEAIKKGTDKDEVVQKKLNLLIKQYLANELLSKRLEGVGNATEFEVKEYFQTHERDFNSQVKIAHILLSTEEQARIILEKLKAKEDFITLARRFSQDSITAVNGGLLPPYFKFGEMFDTPEFEAAAFVINKLGGLSGVVKTDFGFHIIKLIDRKPTKEKVTLNDVSMQISQVLTTMKQKTVMDTWLDSLRTHAEIETHYELIK